MNYSGIPIFLTAKRNGNWLEKSGVRKIGGGIKSHLFYRGTFYKIQEGRQQRYITLVNVWTIFIYQQNVHLKQNENFRI